MTMDPIRVRPIHAPISILVLIVLIVVLLLGGP